MARNISHFQTKEPVLESFLATLRYKKIVKHIPANTTVLDLGSGHKGRVLRSLSQKIRNGVGYDFSVTNEKLPSNIKLQSHQVDKKLPIKSNSIDAVISLAVIEHVNNPRTLLRESYRVLKHDGVFLLTSPSIRAKPILEFLAFRLGIISKKEIRDHKRYYDSPSLVTELLKAGFQENRIEIKSFEFGLNIFAKAIK